MPEAITAYQCSHCSGLFKSKAGVTNHEKSCPKNPIHDIRRKAELQRKGEIDKIRNTATSPAHLIELVKEFLLKQGLKLTITSYPNTYNHLVSNSHNSPRGYEQNWCGNKTDQGVPRGYPGWVGKWSGQIDVIDGSILGVKDRRITISALNRWGDFGIDLDFLHTGSGGSRGDGFEYDGMLFVYDFPLMELAWKEEGKELEYKNNEYLNNLQEYHKKFASARTNYISSDDNIRYANSLITKMTEMSRDLQNANKAFSEILKREYNEKYGCDFPIPPNCLANTQVIENIQCDIAHGANRPHPNMKNLFERVERLSKEVEMYRSNHPEIFI